MRVWAHECHSARKCVHMRVCVWGQLNEGGSFDRQLVCGAAIDSPCACVCSTALGEFHAPWATWQSTSDRELLISTGARRLTLWGGWICDSLAERREEREGGEIQNPQGSIRGLLQVNVATTHFLCCILKGLSNDVVICCLIAGIAEGNLRRRTGSHTTCTHIKMQKERRRGGGRKAWGRWRRGKI